MGKKARALRLHAEHDRGLVVDDVRVVVEQAAQLGRRLRRTLARFRRQVDVRERPAIAVTFVVLEQRFVHRAIRGLLQAAVDRRRDLEAGRIGLGTELTEHLGANHLRHVGRIELGLRAVVLAEHGLVQGGLVLGVRDRAGLVHPPQNVRAPRGRPLDARDWIEVRGAVRNAREQRDLRDRELVEILTEIGPGRRHDAVRALPEEARVHVEIEDLLFSEFALDPEREDPLLELLDEALVSRAQARARQHVQRARDLLRDRAAAYVAAARADLVEDAAQHAAVVDSRMLEEVLILGREHGLDQQRRNVPVGDWRAFDFAELPDQPAVAAIDLERDLNLDAAQLLRSRQARREVVIAPDSDRCGRQDERGGGGQNRERNLDTTTHF